MIVFQGFLIYNLSISHPRGDRKFGGGVGVGKRAGWSKEKASLHGMQSIRNWTSQCNRLWCRNLHYERKSMCKDTVLTEMLIKSSPMTRTISLCTWIHLDSHLCCGHALNRSSKNLSLSIHVPCGRACFCCCCRGKLNHNRSITMSCRSHNRPTTALPHCSSEFCSRMHICSSLCSKYWILLWFSLKQLASRYAESGVCNGLPGD